MGEIKYDVFISFKHSDANNNKTKDSAIAEKVYNFLREKGCRVFFSLYELEFLGQSQYSKVIDEALDDSKFLIAVGCSRENLDSEWVRHEWSSFLNDIRSGAKPGAEVYVVYADMTAGDLPRSLRQRQAFNANESDSFEKLYNFMKNAGLQSDVQKEEEAAPVANVQSRPVGLDGKPLSPLPLPIGADGKPLPPLPYSVCPPGSVIPISLASGETIFSQSFGGTFEADESFGKTQVSYAIRKKKGYITLSNQRIIWTETNDKSKKAAINDETSIYFNDISAFTPWSFPDANARPKIVYAFLINTEIARYGFYFDDAKDKLLLKKRNTFMEYICKERGITFAPNNNSLVPVSLMEDEYIEIQSFAVYPESGENGCITITNRRFIWTYTSLFGKNTDYPYNLNTIRSIVAIKAATKTGRFSADFTMEVEGEELSWKFSITRNNDSDKAIIRDWIVCFVQENLQKNKHI